MILKFKNIVESIRLAIVDQSQVYDKEYLTVLDKEVFTQELEQAEHNAIHRYIFWSCSRVGHGKSNLGLTIGQHRIMKNKERLSSEGIDTLAKFKAKYPNQTLTAFLVGTDVLPSLVYTDIEDHTSLDFVNAS